MTESSLVLPSSYWGVDPDIERAKIYEQIDTDEIENVSLFGNRVLVAKWIRKEIGSLITPEQSRKEDTWQGKVGLVLKVGPIAFRDDPAVGIDWCGLKCEPNDWVLYSKQDGEDFGWRPKGKHTYVEMKILREGDIAMVLPRPDFAY